MLEVDDLGLERQDRRYLETLITVFTGGPAGLNAIAHTMHVSPDTLEDEVEPFLLRCGLIQRTARGRVVTAAGYQHLKLPPPPRPANRRCSENVFWSARLALGKFWIFISPGTNLGFRASNTL